MTRNKEILQHILSAPSAMPAQALHVAISTDGNGRWAPIADCRALPDHRAGAEAQPLDHRSRSQSWASTRLNFRAFFRQLATAAAEVHPICDCCIDYS